METIIKIILLVLWVLMLVVYTIKEWFNGKKVDDLEESVNLLMRMKISELLEEVLDDEKENDV